MKLNIGMFCLTITFSGICFLASCIFNLSKYAVGAGGFFVGLSLLFALMRMFSDKLDKLKYLTFVTLYDLTSITSGSNDYIVKLIVLVVVGIAAYIAGINVFKKKDLPL